MTRVKKNVSKNIFCKLSAYCFGCNVLIRTTSHKHWGILNHQQFDCLSNSLHYSGWWQHHQKSTLLALCEGKPPVTGGFPSQRASNAESVSMSCHHHVQTATYHLYCNGHCASTAARSSCRRNIPALAHFPAVSLSIPHRSRAYLTGPPSSWGSNCLWAAHWQFGVTTLPVVRDAAATLVNEAPFLYVAQLSYAQVSYTGAQAEAGPSQALHRGLSNLDEIWTRRERVTQDEYICCNPFYHCQASYSCWWEYSYLEERGSMLIHTPIIKMPGKLQTTTLSAVLSMKTGSLW